MPAEMTRLQTFLYLGQPGRWLDCAKGFQQAEDGLMYRERFEVGFRALESPGTAGAGSCSL